MYGPYDEGWANPMDVADRQYRRDFNEGVESVHDAVRRDAFEQWCAKYDGKIRALVAAMPRCIECQQMATRRHRAKAVAFVWCDAHAPSVQLTVELPYVAPVRALQAMVDEKESGK